MRCPTKSRRTRNLEAMNGTIQDWSHFAQHTPPAFHTSRRPPCVVSICCCPLQTPFSCSSPGHSHPDTQLPADKSGRWFQCLMYAPRTSAAALGRRTSVAFLALQRTKEHRAMIINCSCILADIDNNIHSAEPVHAPTSHGSIPSGKLCLADLGNL